MSNQPTEFSEDGNPIYRHRPREKPFELAIGDAAHIELIEGHIAKYVGQPSLVLHEIISDLVHIDIQIIPPAAGRNFYVLVTTGMSMRAMKVPQGAEMYSYAELFICLRPDWRMQQEDLKDERNYWPIRLLKLLARLPHEYDTWLGVFHTVPNGNPAQPYAADTKLCGAMITPAQQVSDDFRVLTVSPEMPIHFYAVVPLYQEEIDLKLKSGGQVLCDRLDNYKISEILDVRRRNVAKKRFGFF